MRVKIQAVAAIVASSAIVATALFLESLTTSNAQTRARYLPEYTASGDLILPKDFHEWVYVGSPLTPNALNGGTGRLPGISQRLHRARRHTRSYKKTDEFPEGTIFFKELQLTLPAAEPRWIANRTIGQGLFPGTLQRRRRDRQGLQAFCRHQRVGILQLQPS